MLKCRNNLTLRNRKTIQKRSYQIDIWSIPFLCILGYSYVYKQQLYIVSLLLLYDMYKYIQFVKHDSNLS